MSLVLLERSVTISSSIAFKEYPLIFEIDMRYNMASAGGFFQTGSLEPVVFMKIERTNELCVLFQNQDYRIAFEIDSGFFLFRIGRVYESG